MDSVPSANLNLSGRISTPDGKPASGIVVFNDAQGGSPPVRQETVTDEKGNFRFADAGQVIRIEDPDYRPVARFVTAGRRSVSIRLQSAKNSTWTVAPCSEDIATRVGFDALILIPPAMDSSFDGKGDHKTYFIFPKGSDALEAELIIFHKSQGNIESADGWNSKSFSQRWIKDPTGSAIGVEWRGRTEKSEYYRGAVFGGHDMLGYSLNLPTESPDALDRIIDSVCTRPK